MKVAIEGCAHGELQKIYETIQGIEKAENIKIDLLLCCGDFQSTRNLEDLQTMAVPQKYMDMCTFYKYYSGELVAPILTIFIGGNHEASNYLQELPYGGWVAPNIYYLGYAGVVRVNGIRIGGLSGIYKGHDYLRGHHEFPPYNDSTCRSVYHVRQLEVFRLKQLSGKLDICMSHDWPRGIYNYGNKAQLARFKPHFRDEMDNDQLGSRPAEDLLKCLKPSYWFAAHLHCKFSAMVPHDSEKEDEHAESKPDDSTLEGLFTKFLALDKCLPRRRFLQVLDIESADHTDDGELRFEYDLEWLTILQLTNHLTNVKNANYYLPGPKSGISEERYNFTPTAEELQHVRQRLGNELRIPQNFGRTVPAYDASNPGNLHPPQPKALINPQCTQFCDTLGLDDPLSLAMIMGGHELNHSSTLEDSSSLLLLAEQSSLNSSSCVEDEVASPLKRKCGLSLPKPVAADARSSPPLVTPIKQDITNPDELQLDESSDEEQLLESAPDSANMSIDKLEPELQTAEILNEKPPIKKFKRRNQQIYQVEEEDQEDK